MSKRKNADGIVVLAYLRYILPVVILAALVLSIFIPCLDFTVVSNDGITGGEMSVAELLDNSWETVRGYLFGGGKREAAQEAFSWTVLVMIPVFWMLYAVGVISAVCAAVGSLLYFRDENFKKTDGGVWFITVFPNRIVVSALHVLVLPLLFYHRILVFLYGNLMNISVKLEIVGAEPWVLGLIALAVIFALSAVSAYYEKKNDIDPFKKRIPPVVRVIDSYRDETAQGDTKNDEYEELNRRAREEQAEYIRRLLNKNDEEDG